MRKVWEVWQLRGLRQPRFDGCSCFWIDIGITSEDPGCQLLSFRFFRLFPSFLPTYPSLQSSIPRESSNRRAIYPANWWHFCGRAIKWFQALRKLARWRTNQLLIKPLSFRDGRHDDRGGNEACVCLPTQRKSNYTRISVQRASK